MKELKIVAIIALVIVLSYLGYKWYNYYQCKNSEGSPCSKARYASSSTISRGANLTSPLNSDEISIMNALANQVNSGMGLSSSDWEKLNGLIYRNVKNGGSDPVLHNDGKVKCSFWKKSCQ